MTDENERRLKLLPGFTRREVIVGSGSLSVLAAAGSSSSSAKTTAIPTGTEGYFLVFDENKDEADSRVFFISSEWLELFEVTDAYNAKGIKPEQIAKQIRKNTETKRKFRVLYGDNADIFEPVEGATFLPPVRPTAGQTYLAMMISLNKIPDK